MPKVLKITLVKSVHGNVPRNRATVHALGLRKIGQWTLNHPTPSVLGMIHAVKHLLKVEEVEVEGELRTLRRRDPRKAAPVEAEVAPVAEEAAPAKPKRATKKKEEVNEPA